MPLAARMCHWPPILALLAILAVLLALAFLGIALQRTFLPHRHLARYHDNAGVLYQMIAMVYAVLLASMAVGVWDNYKQAKQVAEQEAAAMLGIARIVRFHPQAHAPKLQRLRHAILVYGRLVRDDEFPAMGRMERSAAAVDAFQTVWADACDLDPRSLQDSNIQQEILAVLAEAQKYRVARLLAATRGLPATLWFVIAACSVITMASSAIFSSETFWPQFWMTLALAAITALVIFAVVTLNYPFVGKVSVTPDGWQFVIRHLQ